MVEYNNNTASFCKFNTNYNLLLDETKNISLEAEIDTCSNDNKTFTNYYYDFTLHNDDYHKEAVEKMCDTLKKDNSIRMISLTIRSINYKIFNSEYNKIFINTLAEIIEKYDKTINIVEINLLKVNSKTIENSETINELFLLNDDKYKQIAKILNNIKSIIINIIKFYLLRVTKTTLKNNVINILKHTKYFIYEILYHIEML